MNEKGIQKYYKYFLYIVVVILINLVGLNIFFRIDLTANKLYSLSKASKEAVSSLKEPLTVNVFFTKNLPAPHNNTEKYLHDLMEEYEIHSNDYLSYRFYDVSAKEGDLSEKAEENRKIAQNYGIHPVNVQKIEQDEAKVLRAYMGMVFIHGNIIEKIQAVTSTDGLEYKITSTIHKMNNKISALLNLPEKIKITLVQSSSLHQVEKVIKLKGLDELKDNVENIVNNLNKKIYNQMELIYIDPTENPEIEKKIEKYKRFGFKWPELKTPDGMVIQAGNGILAIGLEYRGKSIERQLFTKSVKLTNRGLEEQFEIPDPKAIETFIDENIDNLIDINEDLGYLSSHGTLSISPSLPPQMRMMQQKTSSLTKFNSLLSKSYTVKQVSLKDSEIPESIDTLIIAGAKENFSDWDLFQIDQFLMKGKSLAIFMDAFNEVQQRRGQQMYGFNQSVYLPLNTGLEKLLDHYGLNVKKSYIMDESCYVNRGGINREKMLIYYAPIIKNENINHNLNFMKNITQLIGIKMSPLEVNKEMIKKNSLKLNSLFSSTERSWEMSGRINLMPMFIRPPASDKDRKSWPLAYILEGEFKSYFADKQVPQKPKKENKEEEKEIKKKEEEKEKDKKKKGSKKPVLKESKIKSERGILSKGRPGKIFLIGSSDILKDNILDEEGESPNAVFLLNTIDYLNNREDIAVMRGKNQRFNPIKDTKPIIRRFVKLLNIGGLPIMFVFLGIVIWFRRKARRRTIQMRFKK